MILNMFLKYIMRTLTLFLILALLSALILKEGFGMSPGTLTQLESTHVGNPMGSYLLF